MQADGDGSIRAVLISLIDFSVTGYIATFLPPTGAFLSDSATVNGINAERIFFMKIRNTFLQY
jgi:hypothetical protein